MSASGEASAELQAAWNELHLATPPDWIVGLPSQRDGGSWEMYAFDQTEKPKVGRRSREWTAIGQTEHECIRVMARCLREIGAGRVPSNAATGAPVELTSLTIDNRRPAGEGRPEVWGDHRC